jgi:transporter family-2 protein
VAIPLGSSSEHAPPWAFLGGALGATFELGSIIAIPKAGTIVVICSGIVGQMIGSYLIDAFDLLGVDKVPASFFAKVKAPAFVVAGTLGGDR